tara:strand:+ start:172 stop:384 length:213 start_codon:yes stop_codon:yes gene_type:complete
MEHSIIVKTEFLKNVKDMLRVMPCEILIDKSSLEFKNESIVTVFYGYKNKAKMVKKTNEIENLFTDKNRL